ncbi:hypothetical protein EWE75_08675 [Sphingomonas populi]|uniref:TonB-dependent receptor n=1 Tax=Sphingomonas populi TaxID=2484750 RepID=A0A4Q6XXT6_9SPHN|nr:hypothetical protein EWE75_08675 [Sphingomonas populi]
MAFALVAGVCCCPAFAQAPAPSATDQPAPPASDTIRLSDRERDAILDSNTVESAAAARGELGESGGGGRGIHGEVGAMIGSNGTRGAYGVAAIPLGDNAGAVVSFESSQFGGYRRSR